MSNSLEIYLKRFKGAIYFAKVEEEAPANKPADVEEGGDVDKEKNGEVK